MDRKDWLLLGGFGMLAAAIVAGSWIVGHQLASSVDEKNIWGGSGVPQAAGAVEGAAGAVTVFVTDLKGWVRVG